MADRPVITGTALPTISQFGYHYFNRTGTAKSNFYDNKPDETQYFYTEFVDSKGIQLNGKPIITR